MDEVRIGRSIRALRRRRGWRQRDLAQAAGVSQSTASLVERGHLDATSLGTLRAIAAALDARLLLSISWRAGDLDRLVDQAHADLGSTLAARLGQLRWRVAVEVSYAEFGERGSIDLLAFHPESRCLLVVEIKTEIASGEQTLRKLDEKVRLAAKVARERFSWNAATVSRLLAIADSSTNRRRIQQGFALLDVALPAANVAATRWLRRPSGVMNGRLFLSPSDRGAGMHKGGGRSRVRVAGPGSTQVRPSTSASGTARWPGAVRPPSTRGLG